MKFFDIFMFALDFFPNDLDKEVQEPGWACYIGHPIVFIMRKTILDHF